MFLKTLTLTGFKSFQKKTTIDFDSRINGIIGPNGSGKSNLIEAIQFAMGEQSGKSLRGNTMKDIIFSGSQTEKALNRAKVQLILDNSDRLLKDYGDLVTISRILYRDGTSEYEINGQKVRQKDVQALFFSAGLGRDTLAFITQGKVQKIIDSDPVARRGVFEEVAGVYKYKLNRREAVNNLESTDFEVQRLKDLLLELNNNLKPLENESKRATEYANLKDLYDRINLYGIVAKIKKIVLERDQKIELQKKLEKENQQYQENISTVKTQITAEQNKEHEYQENLDHLQQKLVTLIKSRDQVNSKHQVLLTKKSQNEAQIVELNNHLLSLRKEALLINEQQEKVKKDLEEIEPKLNLKFQKQTDLNSISGKDLESLNQELANLKEQYFDLLNKKTNLRNKLNLIENEVNSRNKIIANYQKRIQEKNLILADLKQQQTNFEQKIKDSQKVLSQLQKSLANINQKLQDFKIRQEKLKQQLSVKQNDQQILKTQVNELANQERSLNGFFDGVKVIIKNADKIGGIVGTIFQLVQVPEKYQTALSEALGTRFQNIVTVDEAAAKRAIAFLKAANKGRATFYPLDRIKAQELNHSVKEKLNQEEGFLGVALDLIEFNPQYRSVISNFFGKLLIANDLDAATNLSHLMQSRYRIVTLAGDLINIGGSLTGGKSNKRHDYFRKSEITEKKKLIVHCQQEILVDQNKLKNLQNEQQELLTSLSHINEQIRQVNLDLSKLNQDLTSVITQEKSIKDQTAELNLEIAEQNRNVTDSQEIINFQDQLKINASELTEMDQQMTVINNQIEQQLQADVAGKQSKLEAEIATLKERKLNFQQRLKDFLNQQSKNQEEQVTDQNKVNNLQKQNLEITADLKATSNQLKEFTKSETDLNQNKETLIAQQQSLKVRQEELAKQLSQHQQLFAKVENSLNDLGMQSARFKIQLDNLLDNLANDYEMSYEAAQKAVLEHELTSEELKIDPKKIQKQLRDFGNVNLAAVNEYQKLKERVDFSQKQLKDVQQARVELQESIDQLDEQVRHLFKKAFDTVNQAFQEIYPIMFSGGNAELKLTEPEDLLHTGVEIIAAPPGKKSRSLSLLSGGEKSLSAITLLFAIIKVSTVPFSILDEVEAALDEANVDRFSQYLETLNSKTQFIVITHRRSTMRAAQRLFGVTMVGTGISKIVSVRLDGELINKE